MTIRFAGNAVRIESVSTLRAFWFKPKTWVRYLSWSLLFLSLPSFACAISNNVPEVTRWGCAKITLAMWIVALLGYIAGMLARRRIYTVQVLVAGGVTLEEHFAEESACIRRLDQLTADVSTSVSVINQLHLHRH
jgi:hypothetical protein